MQGLFLVDVSFKIKHELKVSKIIPNNCFLGLLDVIIIIIIMTLNSKKKWLAFPDTQIRSAKPETLSPSGQKSPPPPGIL